MQALFKYANIDDLTPEELASIEANGQMGIADVLSSRANVVWGWSGSDDGEHTDTPVPVFAFGPFAYQFEGEYDNTDVGGWLFDAVG
jgi:alkaline phosphatase